jgi:hypothetical protein
LCVANGLTARVAIRSAAGNQEIILSCRLRALSTNTATPAARRRRRRHRRHRNTTMGDAANLVATAMPASIAPTPVTSPPHFSPIPSPPPAKRTRKAVKRRCEAELLRYEGEEDTLLLSPPHGSPPPPALLPHPPPITPPMSRTPPPLPPLEQGLTMPICATPELPSPTAAPTDLSTPPPTALAPQPASEIAGPAHCPATADRPPSLPPWPESYVFSTDPDRIVCRKCCQRHYNFRWYSRCFMCHMNENRT